jgi:hypothetical protein
MTAGSITAALLLLSAPLVAQQEEPLLELGDRVRVTEASRRMVGTIVALDSARIGIRTQSADDGRAFRCLNEHWAQCEKSWAAAATDTTELSWELSEVESVEVSQGGSGNAGWGALVGFGVGVGVALASTSEPDCPPPPPTCDSPLCALCIRVNTGPTEEVLAGLLGLGVGAGIGSLIKTEKWATVEPPAKPAVAVRPTGRFTLGVSVPLRW